VGLCLFHISKSGHGVEDVAINTRASSTSLIVIVGVGVVDVVVGVVGNSWGKVG
jgi:hypothetical protein